jgi:F-type H+-transporting ATPase subunit alpha
MRGFKIFKKLSVNKGEFEKDFGIPNNKHRATQLWKYRKVNDEITDVIQTVAKEISAKYI